MHPSFELGNWNIFASIFKWNCCKALMTQLKISLQLFLKVLESDLLHGLCIDFLLPLFLKKSRMYSFLKRFSQTLKSFPCGTESHSCFKKLEIIGTKKKNVVLICHPKHPSGSILNIIGLRPRYDFQ